MAALMALHFHEHIFDTAGMTTSILLLTLYVLAFFRALKLIHLFSFVFIITVVICGLRKYRRSSEQADTQARNKPDALEIQQLNPIQPEMQQHGLSQPADLLRVTFQPADLQRVVFQPAVISFLLIIAAITILTRDQIYTWWDDINFWSSDAKQLFYMNGFPGKYGNVSPEFGDYPPVTSLFKWLFMQLSPGKYSEGLQFAGYYTLNALMGSFIVAAVAGRMKTPTTGWGNTSASGQGNTAAAGSWAGARQGAMNLSGFKNSAAAAIRDCLCVILLFLIPGIVNGIIFYGTPADITMGIVYGALLHAIWDRYGHDALFYYGRISLYASILLLTKSVGIEWAAFALLFALMLIWQQKAQMKQKDERQQGVTKQHEATRRQKATKHQKTERQQKLSESSYVFGNGQLHIRYLLSAAFLPAAAYGSWLAFCLVNRRVAKLTAAGIQMASQGVSLPENALDKARYFWLGLWIMPMHADHNITLDLPIGALILLILILPLILYKFRLITRTERRALNIFQLLTSAAAYGLILAAHISIFKTEDQYLDAFAMTNSIARYGAPFTLGGIFLLMSIALERSGRDSKYDSTGRASCPEQQTNTNTNIIGNSLPVPSHQLPDKRLRLVYAACALFILLTADYTGTYRALAGYHDTLEENKSANASMIDDSGKEFLKALSTYSEENYSPDNSSQDNSSSGNYPPDNYSPYKYSLEHVSFENDSQQELQAAGAKALWGRRVLFLRDGSENHRVHDTYISKEASPVPVVYDSIYPEYDSAQTIEAKIAASHAEFVYVEAIKEADDEYDSESKDQNQNRIREQAQIQRQAQTERQVQTQSQDKIQIQDHGQGQEHPFADDFTYGVLYKVEEVNSIISPKSN